MNTPETAASSPQPLWSPSETRTQASEIDRFRRIVLPTSTDTEQLWQWSVDEPGSFWRSVWNYCEVIGDPGAVDEMPGETFRDHRFLPDATLNVAENLLADRAGAGRDAIIARWEDGKRTTMSWAELRSAVGAAAIVLREAGVGPGDRVAAWMPHIPETVVAFLAAASIGAVFTSTSADFGVDGVVDRFGQTEPTVLIAADGYRYGGKTFDCLDRLDEIRRRLPSLKATFVVANLGHEPDVGELKGSGLQGSGTIDSWTDALAAARSGDGVIDPTFTALPFDHRLYILYSSGTTGKPKCIVHRAGGVLLKHLSEQRLHCDIVAGDRAFFFTTCGWMMWNWLVSCLGSGATIVLYEGNPSFPTLPAVFEVAAAEEATMLGVSAKYIDAVMKGGGGRIDSTASRSLKTICSTGSPLSPEGFEWIYRSISSEVHLASISGGTDLCGCLVLGDPTRPVYAGEIQAKALGVAVEVFDDEGRALGPGVKGELVCTAPFPSQPLAFWDDADGRRYKAAYFDRFDGIWAHGDYASWTDHGGMVIHGRSDATLNASGVRIGTAEIYRVVEQLDEVAEAIAIGQQWAGDTRVVLFVRLVGDEVLSDDLIARIKADVRTKCSPRHVPAVVAAVADIPRTRSGKIVELAVTEVVHGRPIKNMEALANPEALDHFTSRAELS